MAGITKISQLCSSRTDWTIRVMVYKRWLELVPDAGDVLHFILLDDQDSKIQTTVGHKECVPYFLERLHEGGLWKRVRNFNMVSARSARQVTTNCWQIEFDSSTKILGDLKTGDFYKGKDPHLHLLSYENLYLWNFQRNCPVDLIGAVETVGELRVVRDRSFQDFESKITARIEFTLTDDMMIKCFAHGKLAIKFNDRWCYCTEQLVICVLSDWRVVVCIEEYHVTDHLGVSRVLFNPDLQEAYELRDMLIGQSEYGHEDEEEDYIDIDD